VTLAIYLKTARLNDAEFGRRIGVPRQYVQRYRHGSIPTPEIMERIVAATDGQVTANDFFGIAA
jgi:transcriptional regulator with XRE-family HTH domain